MIRTILLSTEDRAYHQTHEITGKCSISSSTEEVYISMHWNGELKRKKGCTASMEGWKVSFSAIRGANLWMFYTPVNTLYFN